ncbi:MAG: 6-phosphogluconolactonase [Burkholderiales bacterium]
MQHQTCHWHVYSSAREVQQHAVISIVRSANRAIAERGEFHIVLAGGSTPRTVYQLLREADTSWSSWYVYFGDERCLPPDHPERNSLMAETALLDYVAIPETQIFVIPAEMGAEQAAKAYANRLAAVDLFDLVLLGLGEDGHTASLFPNHDWGAGSQTDAVLAVHGAPKPPPDRVSLSAWRLSRSRQVTVLVTGRAKHDAVARWRDGVALPIAAITPECGVEVLLEQHCLVSGETD